MNRNDLGTTFIIERTDREGIQHMVNRFRNR